MNEMNADEYRAMIELAKNAGQRNVKCVDRKLKHSNKQLSFLVAVF
jgi:hypothetical protein